MGEQLSEQTEMGGGGDDTINIRVSSGGQIYNDLGIWDRVLIGWQYMSQYGWFILFGCVILLYIWYKLQPSFQSWRKKQRERQEERNFDPVKAERYEDAMMIARERMQQKLNEDAAVYATKMEERKAKERDEKISQWEEFKVVSKSKTKLKSTSRERNYTSGAGYNPLSGGGGGGGYRSSRRQVGGGG